MERKGSKRFRRTRNIMQSLRRRLSFRKKKDSVPECSKPHQWQEDEKKVRDGTCSFQVRYLGYIEVFDSRGMHVCEEAVKALKAQCKGKYQRAVLYVSGDALRVVDEISKSMIVDQTIEKVSFCAPDRNHDKGFAYICRDGTTRRWMCHGFLAVKESGERLSHAVGCAFAICLEKKQKRDKETGVTVTFNPSRTSFERTGSFRQTTLTEKLADPQSAIVAEPVPVRSASNPFAVQRPHASANLLERQGSFRGFGKLQETSSPFKHTLSLRLNELPSTLQRQNAVLESPTQNGNGAIGGAIPEASQEQEDSIAKMCQQLTQGLTAMTTDEQQQQAAASNNNQLRGLPHQASLPASYQHRQHPQPLAPPPAQQPTLLRQHTSPASQTLPATVHQPVTNPWAKNNSASQARMWGADGGAGGGQAQAQSNAGSNPFANTTLHQQTNAAASPSVSMSTAYVNGSQQPPPPPLRPPPQQPQYQHQQNYAHSGRSHSIDTGEMSTLHWQHQQQQQHSHRTAGTTAHQSHNGAAASSGSNPWPTTTPPSSSMSSGPGVDPFDVAWAAKSVGPQNNNPNPFGSKSVQQFEVKL